jgi:hypothetical protein
MKFVRVVVCIIAAIAFAATFVSTGYAYGQNFGDEYATSLYPSLISMNTPGYVSPLLAKEIAVFTDQGIPLARAIQAIEAQSEVGEAELPGKLQTAMGSAYAGVWFEGATAQLHVGVTTADAQRTAETVAAQAGLTSVVTFTPVRSTSAQLIAAQKRWDGKLNGLSARKEATTGLQPRYNAVFVALSPMVTSSQRATLEREAARDSVNVRVATRGVEAKHLEKDCNVFTGSEPMSTESNANCNPSITAGVQIWAEFECDPVSFRIEEDIFLTKAACEKLNEKGEEGEWEREGVVVCSAGPAALPLAKRQERVLLTAGHCLERGGGTNVEWFASTRADAEPLIGKSIAFKNGGGAGEGLGDYGDIKIEPGGGWQTGNAGKPVLAVTARWATLEESRYPIKKEKLAVDGEANCHSGRTIGEWCGEIFTINEKYEIEGKTYEGMAQDERMIVEGGDSGGPVFSVNMANEISMEGTLAAEFAMTCEKMAMPKGEYFKTQTECLRPKTYREKKEGEWERNQFVYWQPLNKPETGLVQGSLERLGLLLVTTGNETIPQFLLAEWLVGGAAVTTELPTQTTAELALEDTKALVGKVKILCSFILDGWIGSNALGWVSEVLNLTGEAISSTPLSGLALECTAQAGCESGSAPKVWPVGLGWETEAALMEYTSNYFTLLFLPHSGGGNPGWEMECLVLGVAASDECKASESVAELTLEGTTLLGKFSPAFMEIAEDKLASCTQGGEETGVLEGSGSIVLTGGGELTASSEGSVS